MKLNFIGDTAEILSGAEELSVNLGFETDSSGITVNVEKTCDNGLSVYLDNKNIRISYSKPADFYRALAILVYRLRKNENNFKLTEKRAFNSNGAMLDVSRNAVLKVDAVKKFVRYLALMGHDTLYIYMEDTYKIDGYEYFGYMRGAYTKDELKEIVAYAEIFGIEVIPCIQTLAHLAKTLKWRYAMNMSDTDDILLR